MTAHKPTYNSGSLPHVYRASGVWLAIIVGCGLLLLVAGSAGMWFFTTQPLKHPSPHYWLVGLCGAFAVLGLHGLLSALRSKVILFDDRIEVIELFSTKAMARRDIRGWGSIPTSPPGFVLVPLQPQTRSLKFTQTFQPDAAFADWLLGLPCLDKDDARTSKAEIRNNPNLGATPSERMRTLARGRRLEKVLAIITCVLCLWGFAYPRPYELLVFSLALLPWIALAIVNKSNGLFHVDGNRNSAHPNVAFTLLFPAIVLFLRSTDFEIIYSGAVVWLSAALGILLLLSSIKVDPTLRTRPGSLIWLVVIFLIYSYGATIEANVLFDHTTGVTYTVPVTDRRIVRGKSIRYMLRLGPWGLRTEPNEIRVGRQTYEYIRPGNVANLVVKPGAFGVQWYYFLSWQLGPTESNRISNDR